MTTTTPAKRPVVGVLIALAGLFAALAIVLPYVAPFLGGVWLVVSADAALTLAFLFLFIGRTSTILLRAFFAVATIGWAILTVGRLIDLGTLLTVGILLAIAGSLISGLLAFGRRIFTRAANIFFVLAMLVMTVVLLDKLIGPFILGTLAVVVSAIYALILLIAGITIAIRK